MAVKFSILVVCLNPGTKLAETVESIRKQEYRDYEIIVKDGGSKDGSTGLLPADEKIRFGSCRGIRAVFKLRRFVL